jgi:hypothetical protein
MPTRMRLVQVYSLPARGSRAAPLRLDLRDLDLVVQRARPKRSRMTGPVIVDTLARSPGASRAVTPCWSGRSTGACTFHGTVPVRGARALSPPNCSTWGRGGHYASILPALAAGQ